MTDCIALMRDTLAALHAQGGAPESARHTAGGRAQTARTDARRAGRAREVCGAKLITVFPDNYNLGLPSHQGVVVLFETRTGSVEAIVDAEAITAIRTAAVRRRGDRCPRPERRACADAVWHRRCRPKCI